MRGSAHFVDGNPVDARRCGIATGGIRGTPHAAGRVASGAAGIASIRGKGVDFSEHEGGANTAPPGWTVLIIDDNEDDREAFMRALRKVGGVGLRCLEAADGAHGVAMIGEHCPDCALLDYSLPGRNGLAILKLIHSVDPFLPVIMLTGQGNEAVAVQAMKSGAQNYLVKSNVTPDMLFRAVEFAVQQAALERKIGEQREQIRGQQEALSRTNRLNSAILDGAAYMIVATDIDGTILVFNRAAERALGYSAAELIGKGTPMLWFDRAEVEQRAARLREDFDVHVEPDFDVLVWMSRHATLGANEWTFVRRDGSRFPVHLSITPLKDDTGQAVGFVAMIEDITERRRQDEALRASEQTFRSAIEHAPNGMALVDPAGGWLKVNQALCHLLDLEQDELKRRNFRSLVGLDNDEADPEGMRALLAGSAEVVRREKRLVLDSGRVVWVLLNLSLARDAGGAPKHFILQFQDITEHKEMDRMKSEFISVVSHELRTPLTSIRGSLGFICATMANKLPDKAAHLVDVAYENCERLIVLVNDILDIGKITSGQMRYDVRRENLSALLHQAADANRGFAEKLGVSIALAPVPDEWTVRVDGARLIQILSKLLSNATKFSPHGGVVELFAEHRDRRVRIQVRDHGPGIPPEFSHRIFDKFSQADSSSTRKTGGSGLGLHICKELIEHMGGQIGFESAVGCATLFWVDVPTGEVVDRPPRVLHVGASAELCDGLSAGLRGRAEIVAVTTPDEAERHLREGPFALVVLELTQPGCAVPALLELLAQRIDTPVLILSAGEIPPEARRRASAAIVRSQVSAQSIVETVVDLMQRSSRKARNAYVQ